MAFEIRIPAGPIIAGITAVFGNFLWEKVYYSCSNLNFNSIFSGMDKDRTFPY